MIRETSVTQCVSPDRSPHTLVAELCGAWFGPHLSAEACARASRPIPAAWPTQVRVESVFEHAVNVRVVPEECGRESEAGDALLLSLVTRRSAMSVRALLLERIPGGLRRGMQVALGENRLRLSPVRVEVVFGTSPVYEGRIEAAEAPAGLAEELRAAVVRHGRPGGLLGLIDPRRRNAYSIYAERRLERTREDSAHLLGLGGGLTPSGDDFILGVLAAEALFPREPPELQEGHRPAGRHALARRVERRLVHDAATTEVSRTMLRLACAGRFPYYLQQFAERLRSALVETAPLDSGATPARDAAVTAAVQDAVIHGGTSGTDALVGFVRCLFDKR